MSQTENLHENIVYRVQLGATDDFRYVGVQPPLSPDDTRVFVDRLEEAFSESYGAAVISGRTTTPGQGEPYTEVIILGSPDAETIANMSRLAIEPVLRPGDKVVTDKRLQGIGKGFFLFDGRFE